MGEGGHGTTQPPLPWLQSPSARPTVCIQSKLCGAPRRRGHTHQRPPLVSKRPMYFQSPNLAKGSPAIPPAMSASCPPPLFLCSMTMKCLCKVNYKVLCWPRANMFRFAGHVSIVKYSDWNSVHCQSSILLHRGEGRYRFKGFVHTFKLFKTPNILDIFPLHT